MIAISNGYFLLDHNWKRYRASVGGIEPHLISFALITRNLGVSDRKPDRKASIFGKSDLAKLLRSTKQWGDRKLFLELMACLSDLRARYETNGTYRFPLWTDLGEARLTYDGCQHA